MLTAFSRVCVCSIYTFYFILDLTNICIYFETVYELVRTELCHCITIITIKIYFLMV